MNPTFHVGRRMARAQALHDRFKNHEGVAYVDAAEYPDHRNAYTAAVVNGSGRPLSIATINTPSPEVAEEAAIALAIANSNADTILSDSKTAIRNYATGRVSATVIKILDKIPASFLRSVELVWVPAHSSNPGNEAAHAFARGGIGRAVGDGLGAGETRDTIITYHDRTQAYRLERLKYPPASKRLSKNQEVIWRQLQTHSFPNPVILAHIHPGLISPNCKLCGDRATLEHIIWQCPEDPPPRDLVGFPSPDFWEAVLLSSDPEVQLRQVRRAEEVAARHELAAT